MRIKALFFLASLLAISAQAEPHRFFIGAGYGLATLSGGDSTNCYLQPSYMVSLGAQLSDRWSLRGSAAVVNLKNDTANPGAFAFSGDKANVTREFRSTRLTLLFDRLLLNPAGRFNVSLAAGPGLLLWKLRDAETDTTLKVIGSHKETVDYSGSELLLNISSSARARLSSALSIQWQFGADYLTGAGTNFESAVDTRRPNWLFSSFLMLNFHFGRTSENPKWNSGNSWKQQSAVDKRMPTMNRPDTDGDGVPDAVDKCNDTPPGIVVDQNGCPRDMDHDGVPDDVDDCPSTDRMAIGYVDIRGCALDGDFDGIPDYRDRCPNNPVGALVDADGCPVDSDQDGVPDGLDDCPNTFPGLEVDHHGCLDLSGISKPMTLYIEYAPGGFEVDPRSKERIRRLGKLLTLAPDVRIEINGYTDDIGTGEANAALSKKRADRVRDFLVSEGVATDRITTFGRGESNFVASNETAEGRNKNRRIEILFLR